MTDDVLLGVYLVRAFIGSNSIIGICSSTELAKQAAEQAAARKGLTLEWVRPVEGTAAQNVKWLGRAGGSVWYTVIEYAVDGVIEGVLHG